MLTSVYPEYANEVFQKVHFVVFRTATRDIVHFHHVTSYFLLYPSLYGVVLSDSLIHVRDIIANHRTRFPQFISLNMHHLKALYVYLLTSVNWRLYCRGDDHTAPSALMSPSTHKMPSDVIPLGTQYKLRKSSPVMTWKIPNIPLPHSSEKPAISLDFLYHKKNVYHVLCNKDVWAMSCWNVPEEKNPSYFSGFFIDPLICDKIRQK